MTLKELQAELYIYSKEIVGDDRSRILPDGSTQIGGFEAWYLKKTNSLAEAQSIMFLCPLCFEKNGGSIGTHSVEVTFANREAPNEIGSRNKKGEPTRWNIIGGTGIDDLQLSPSILLESGCNWHGFIGSNGVQPGHAK